MSVTEQVSKATGFSALGLDERILKRLLALGYEEPTPIQREAIPPLLQGKDVLGQAATGTGKTAAFSLPLVQKILQAKTHGKEPVGLILVPTRELAMQVAEAIHGYGHGVGVRVLPVYGGQAYELQVRALHRGVDVVVATPGRALDHIRQKTLSLKSIQFAVLDEADEMLDMGFLEDIEAILSETPKDKQTALISATMPPRVATIAKRHLKDPTKIQIVTERVEGQVPSVRQAVYIVPRGRKVEAIARLLEVENSIAAIVFCRTRNEVEEVQSKLDAQGYKVEALHGGMSQAQRDRVMKKLRGSDTELVIATDVAARGLDIDRLTHVINYDVPSAPDAYVHRIGRVGRAGREGVAITLASPREHRLLKNIERAIGQRIEVANMPTLADLQARRLEQTRTSIKNAIVEGGLDRYRDVLETLTEEHDLMEIALAAVKLVHKASGADVDESAVAAETVRATRVSMPMARMFVGAGRSMGMRPADLVGAITGEAGIEGREIGAIQIADRFTVVEVSEDLIDRVIEALQGSKIKGQEVSVRRDKDGPGSPAPSPAHRPQKRKRW